MRIRLFFAGIALNAAAFAEPFGLKGDLLGESLSDWRVDHKEVASTYNGVDEYAPMCSDTSPRNTLIRPLRTGVGQVVCQLFYPYQKKQTTIANAPADINFYFNTSIDGHESGNGLMMVSARFDEDRYAQVKEALIARWGTPTESVATQSSNAFGAIFEGEQLVWVNDESQMSLSQYSGSLDRSSLTLTHTAIYSEYQSRTATAPNPNADDL